MTKRIAYLSQQGGTDRRHALERLVTPGFEVEHFETGAWLYPADPADMLVTELAFVEAVMRAEADGFDGVVIGAVSDYGLAVARASVAIPVIGSGQASLVTAAGLGDRFGIVTIWSEAQGFVYDRLLHDSPVGDRCVSVRHVSSIAEQATLADPDNFYTQMLNRRETMIERIVDEIEAAAREGADTVVLGCNCMTPVAETLAARASIPVIDPTAAGYRFVETAVALGLMHAKDARLPARSARQPLFAELVATADHLIGAPEECEVCILDDDGNASCGVPEPAVII